jgi:hypothetical protein
MVSGIVSWWGKTQLYFFDSGESVDSKTYQRVLRQHHFPDLNVLFEGGDWALVQVVPAHFALQLPKACLVLGLIYPLAPPHHPSTHPPFVFRITRQPISPNPHSISWTMPTLPTCMTYPPAAQI